MLYFSRTYVIKIWFYHVMESVGKSQVVLEVNFDCMEIFVIIEFVMRSTERKNMCWLLCVRSI